MISRVALASLVSAAYAADTHRDYSDYIFDAYLQEFDKSYASFAETSQRKALFEANLAKIQTHNKEYLAGDHTWFAAVNHLTDATPEEYARLRSKKYSPSQFQVLAATQGAANPAAIDWRTKGAVTAVKNQGGCGSCWAFSATETLESHYQIASKKSVTLAPQTFVNCVKNPQGCGGTGGCEGATMELAFNLTASTGIALESDIPYAGRDATCKPYKAAVKCTGYVKNPVNSAIGFETALATKGPMAITVAAGSWQFYGGGVFHGCSKGFLGRQDNTLDHGVQAVGYTQDYWIVRNSWGAGWGEKGFIRIQRATDNKTFIDKAPADGTACKPVPKSQTVGGECGILFDTSYPTGVTAGSAEEVVVV